MSELETVYAWRTWYQNSSSVASWSDERFSACINALSRVSCQSGCLKDEKIAPAEIVLKAFRKERRLKAAIMVFLVVPGKFHHMLNASKLNNNRNNSFGKK